MKMIKKEKNYFKFYFIDGTTRDCEYDDASLLSKILKSDRSRIRIGSEIINLDNVTRIVFETEEEREKREPQRIRF